MTIYDEAEKYGFVGGKMIVLPTEVFAGYTENPIVKRMYLTDIGFFLKAENHYKERKEGLEEYIFLFCTEGSGTICVNQKEYHLHKNEAFCIPRFQKHIYYADQENPWSILWVHFKGEDVRYFPLDEYRLVEFEPSYATNRMLFLFDLVFRALDGNYTLDNFIYISNVLSLILAETYNREKENGAIEQNTHVTRIIKFMYAHIREELCLQGLAEAFGLSKSYINAVFLNCTGRSPMDFFINLKMREACRYLRETDLYIYEIAQRLGYKDQYYFSRIFKKTVGTSPKKYRKEGYFYYK